MRTELLIDCDGPEDALERAPWAATVRRVEGGWKVFESHDDAATFDRNAPSVELGREGMGPDDAEDVFQEWCDCVLEHLEETVGYHVHIEIRAERDVQTTAIVASSSDVERAIHAAIQTLWARWCAADGAALS